MYNPITKAVVMFIKIVLGLQGHSGAGMICPICSEPLKAATEAEWLLRRLRGTKYDLPRKSMSWPEMRFRTRGWVSESTSLGHAALRLQESKYRPAWLCEHISFNFAHLYSFPSNRHKINPVLSRSSSYFPIRLWREPAFRGWFVCLRSEVIPSLSCWTISFLSGDFNSLFLLALFAGTHKYLHMSPNRKDVLNPMSASKWPLSFSFLSQNLHGTPYLLPLPKPARVWFWPHSAEHLRAVDWQLIL